MSEANLSLPMSGPFSILALPQEKLNRPPVATVSPEREYVAGQNGFFSSAVGQVLLSLFNDAAELVAGYDIYERMAADPEIAKSLRVLKDGVTSGGFTLIPKVTKEEDGDYEIAQQALALCQEALSTDNLPVPFTQTLDEMVGAALKHGHKIAEKTYKYVTGADGRAQLTLQSVKVKPRGSTSFVVDEFMNLLGLMAARVVQRPDEEIRSQDIIPRDKFFVLTFNREDEDPRGKSFLRPAYNFYQAKRAVLPIYLKWLEKCAIPSAVGFAAENEQPQTDDAGNVRTAAEVMASALAGLDNASAAGFAHGADVKQIVVAGDGSQFSRAFEICDAQISMALLLQTLATREGSRGNGSRAASQTHLQVLELLIWHLKAVVCDAVRQDILADLVALNLGEQNRKLAPYFSLGKSDRDWTPAEVAAIGAMLTDSQFTYATGQLSIPAPLEGEEMPARVKAQSNAGAEPGADLTGANG